MGCKEVEESTGLAVELMKELKRQAKRFFIAFIVCLVMLFVSNIAWLYVYNLPIEETTTTTTIDGSDNGDANFIGNDGTINNGKDND